MDEVLNNFWEIDKRKKLSHLEIHLFLKLLDLAVKSNKSEVIIHNSTLQDEVRTKAKNLIKARKRLVDLNLISVDAGNTRQPHRYRIINLLKESNNLLKESNNLPKESNLHFVDTPYLNLVREFIRYRQQDLKKPFKTERGIRQFYNELMKLSGNNLSKASQLVEHAKAKEWLTVYPIKDKTRKLFRNDDVKHYDNQL